MEKLLVAVLVTAICLTGCSAATEDLTAKQIFSASDALYMQEAVAFSGSEQEDRVSTTQSGGDAAGEETGFLGEDTNPASDDVPQLSKASTVQSPLVCTYFSMTDEEQNAEDGISVFISHCSNVFFSTENAETNAWLRSEMDRINNETELYCQEIYERSLEDYAMFCSSAEEMDIQFYTHSYYHDAATTRQDSGIISLLLIDSSYCGGAHPNYTQIAYNFDLNRQRVLSLADVLYPDTCDELLERLLQKLEDRFASLEGYGLFPEYQETVKALFADSGLTPCWYFTDDSLVIYFNCYDIAPYAAGIVKIAFPYSELEGILLAEFFPEDLGEEDGNLEILENAEDRTVLTLLPDSQSGNPIYLGTNGTIYNVKVCNLSSWIDEQTPIVGQMLFSANRLSSQDALVLCELSARNASDYLVNYQSVDGTYYSFAVTLDGLKAVSLPLKG